jgi:hypothetical protein
MVQLITVEQTNFISDLEYKLAFEILTEVRCTQTSSVVFQTSVGKLTKPRSAEPIRTSIKLIYFDSHGHVSFRVIGSAVIHCIDYKMLRISPVQTNSALALTSNGGTQKH